MTDYELLSILAEFINATWMVFATYVSIVFAFLVAGYLVSNRLTKRMISIVITIYTLVALWSLWGLNRNIATVTAIVAEIKRAVREDGSSLGWVPAVGTPDFLFPIVPILVTMLAVVAYAGSIAFFFHQRKFRASA